MDKKDGFGFYNEFYFRCESALLCLDTFQYIKEDKKITEDINIKNTVKYALIRTAILEVSTLLDSISKYSLRIEEGIKDNFSVEVNRLKKLCKNLNHQEVSLLKDELDVLLDKNKLLLDRIFHMRNKRLAHSGISSYEQNKKDLKIVRFPMKKMLIFIDDLRGIIYKRVFLGRSSIQDFDL